VSCEKLGGGESLERRKKEATHPIPTRSDSIRERSYTALGPGTPVHVNGHGLGKVVQYNPRDKLYTILYRGATTPSTHISHHRVTTTTSKTSGNPVGFLDKKTKVVVVSFGKHEENNRYENRPYIIVAGSVVAPGNIVDDHRLKIGFISGGKEIFFQGGSGRCKLFVGKSRWADARLWCATRSLENHRKVMEYPRDQGKNKSFVSVVSTTKTNMQPWNIPTELPSKLRNKGTMTPVSMMCDTATLDDAVNSDAGAKSDGVNSSVPYTDNTASLHPLLRRLGCKLLQLNDDEVQRLQTSRLPGGDPNAQYTPQDTTWQRTSGVPFRHTFSRLAGSPSAEDWAVYHRYTWGGCTERQSCCHPIPPAVDRVAAYLSKCFDKEFGGMRLNAGQILYYITSTKIGAHDDGSAQSSTAENSQCGHTGVVSITTKGSGTMQFSYRAPYKGSSKQYVCSVELGPGSVFLMSAVCDRLLLHQMCKSDTGMERTAIILRVLNQPRWYKTCAPFNIFNDRVVEIAKKRGR